MEASPAIDGEWIRRQRGAKNAVDPRYPYDTSIEAERTADGRLEEVLTLFLTNRECPFTCLHCDLWRQTTDTTVPPGTILRQVEWALKGLPRTPHLKLYNSGNFFDEGAIPAQDRRRMAPLLRHFETVVVENHPRLVDDRTAAFRDAISPAKLEVAMGLETVHPKVLPRLNKRMSLGDFSRAAEYLHREGIASRAFVLLRPPFLSESDGVAWAKRSLDFAFDCRIGTACVIPTRSGNGALDRLEALGHFTPPSLASLEAAVEYGVGLRRGRVFADLWDAERFVRCRLCARERLARLRQMNLRQEIPEAVRCRCEAEP